MRVVLILAALVSLAACAVPGPLSQTDQAQLAGRTIVITGASSGLGRGAALRFAQYGANVVVAARRKDVLDGLAAEGRALGAQVLVVPTDVSEPDAVQHLADAAVARFGRIDIWVNDAAVAAIGPFAELPVREHARVVDVNLNGYIYGTATALRQFGRQGWGSVVNVASVESYVPLAFQASYAATKAAIRAMDAAIYEELRLAGNRRVSISTVLPWAVDTPFYAHAANGTGHAIRVPGLIDPWSTVDTIVWVAIHPQKEIAAGWKAAGAVVAGQLLPGLSTHIAADLEYRAQFGDAPPAPKTQGNLFRPVPQGDTVEGGTRARIAREDAARSP